MFLPVDVMDDSAMEADVAAGAMASIGDLDGAKSVGDFRPALTGCSVPLRPRIFRPERP